MKRSCIVALTKNVETQTQPIEADTITVTEVKTDPIIALELDRLKDELIRANETITRLKEESEK